LKVKNEWSYTSAHQYVFIAWHKDNVTLVSCSLINPHAYSFRKEFNYFYCLKPVVLEITGVNFERNITPSLALMIRVVVNLFFETRVWDYCKTTNVGLLQFFYDESSVDFI
jgi:hypothetical protein